MKTVPHIYTLEDIQQYLAGKLDSAQMHAMEKAALSDPLLADALDGFSESSYFKNEKSFAQLQDQLTILKKKITTAGNVKDYSNWWKFAAAAILLVGSCFTFYAITNHTDKQKEAAVIQQQTFAKIPEAKDTQSVTTLQSAKSETVDRELKKSKINLSERSITANAIESKKIISDNAIASSADMASAPAPAEPAEMKKKISFTKNKSLSFSGKVTDTHNNAVPYATLIINNQQQATTDNKGYFNLERPDSFIAVEIISANFYSKAITLNADNFKTIELTSSKVSFKKDTSENDKDPESRVEILYHKGTAPLAGWSTYLHFLQDQLSYSTYDDGRKVTGTMIVEFRVDPNFTIPDNFNFEKSIDADVNDAVMQLIQNGPQWKNENTFTPGIVKLEITF